MPPKNGQDFDWRKSSRSNSSGDCVELAILDTATVNTPEQ